jgi:hypothetical protein
VIPFLRLGEPCHDQCIQHALAGQHTWEELLSDEPVVPYPIVEYDTAGAAHAV